MTRAEKNVIGCLLLDPNEVGNTNLEPYMFTDELYRDMFTEILRAYENHKPITDTVIEQALLSDTRPSHFLRQEMAECIQSVSTVMEIRANAEIVRSEYLAKRLGEYLDTIPDPARINEQIGEMVTNLEALRDRRDTSSIRASDMVDKFSDQYFRERPEGIQTGLEGLDETLGDLEPGDVIVIGARPSVGKSALVTQIASHIAKKGKRVGFYNLEMSDKQIYERLIARESGISMQRIRRAIAFT